MAILGFVFLTLLVDYGAIDVRQDRQRWVGHALQVIWGVFLVGFLFRLVIAPKKGEFLRSNWLTVVSLALPFLRPIRALRAVRALRSLSLVRLIGGVNRGMRVLRAVTHGRKFAYVGGLTLLVAFAGAAGVRYIDRGVANAPIQTFGDALWWSAGIVTTINTEKIAVSPEARVIAILQRIYAVSIFGYITASIASYLIGATAAKEGSDALNEELALLRREIVALRADRTTPPGLDPDNRLL